MVMATWILRKGTTSSKAGEIFWFAKLREMLYGLYKGAIKNLIVCKSMTIEN